MLLSGRGEQGAQRVEAVLKNSGLDCNVVRVNWFIHDFSEGFMIECILNGELMSPGGCTISHLNKKASHVPGVSATSGTRTLDLKSGCSFFPAIEDFTAEHISLKMIPGSHKGRVYDHHRNGIFCRWRA